MTMGTASPRVVHCSSPHGLLSHQKRKNWLRHLVVLSGASTVQSWLGRPDPPIPSQPFPTPFLLFFYRGESWGTLRVQRPANLREFKSRLGCHEVGEVAQWVGKPGLG